MSGPLFPADFLWGTATSSYQVEGSPLADGAGPSIWHRFTHTPGLVHRGETGDVACDQYRRYAGDVRLMRELGTNAYRFSVSWSRVLPHGKGAVNSRGLDFYRRLVDELLANGIRPMVTLYHWDLPAALDDRGGWLNPDVAGWFADYAQVMFAALDDRVALWSTINEPWVVTDGGYLHGALAPGHRNLFEAPIASHNLLRAHGAAVAAYRAQGRNAIGLVVNLAPKHPASARPEDAAAAARADVYLNRQYLDPVLLGRYPEELPAFFGEAWPRIDPSDLEQIRQPIDFLGVNYYTRNVVRDDPGVPVTAGSEVRQPESLYTETAWEVYPQGLLETLLWVRRRYGKLPVYITENGAAFADPPPPSPGSGSGETPENHQNYQSHESQAAGARVDDPLRVEYLRSHLRAAAAALAQDVDLRGYFVWSLLDNFEWSLGYSKRFGIVAVDFATQRRIPKASARFYSDVIRTRGAALED
ncbi:MAG TPA: family 1 glycosylhydrolase [Thermoanaerobaculia bacterium]|nr:family 1 glycosylhydrolase [Thermoanaerobaculia bacterium]